jgi:hypothetical protein
MRMRMLGSANTSGYEFRGSRAGNVIVSRRSRRSSIDQFFLYPSIPLTNSFSTPLHSSHPPSPHTMLSVPQSVAFLPSSSPSTASQTTVVGSSGNSLQPSILEVRNRLNQRFQSKLTLHNPTRALFLFLLF